MLNVVSTIKYDIRDVIVDTHPAFWLADSTAVRVVRPSWLIV